MRKLLGLPSGLVRATARLLLLTLSVTTLGPVLHGVHDTACEPVFVIHDESQHHFQAAIPNAVDGRAADHCVACHFVRTSRGPVSWEPAGLHSFASGQRLFHSDGQLAAAPSASPRPARAPPTYA